MKNARTASRRDAIEAFRMAWGLWELLAADRTFACLFHESPDRRTRAAIRTLGTRHLLQAILTNRAVISSRTGGSVDLLHAASMVLLAAVNGRRRAPAMVSASVALLFAAAEFKAASFQGLP
ncbi:MAG TPA: hypothetical protein VJQ60_09030 [Arthrobacter sp.]|nr:hypothetical protein [Arthrobacter sp.]